MHPFVLPPDAHSPMKPDKTTPEQIGRGRDTLLLIEMRIAQRADELRLSCVRPVGTDLIHWMQAEREILESVLSPRRRRSAFAARN